MKQQVERSDSVAVSNTGVSRVFVHTEPRCLATARESSAVIRTLICGVTSRQVIPHSGTQSAPVIVAPAVVKYKKS